MFWFFGKKDEMFPKSEKGMERRTGSLVRKLLVEKLAPYGSLMGRAEYEACEQQLRRIAEDECLDQDELASYGPPIVIPLLVAHAPHCRPESRERMIQTLWRIEEPILQEIVQFLTWFQDSQCARTTAFEALEERACQGKEDLAQVIEVFEMLRNDRNGRIRDNLDYAMGNVRRVMDRERGICGKCGRRRYLFLDPDLRKQICGYCLWGTVPSRWSSLESGGG